MLSPISPIFGAPVRYFTIPASIDPDEATDKTHRTDKFSVSKGLRRQDTNSLFSPRVSLRNWYAVAVIPICKRYLVARTLCILRRQDATVTIFRRYRRRSDGRREKRNECVSRLVSILLAVEKRSPNSSVKASFVELPAISDYSPPVDAFPTVND